jgi:hypothetical protein
VQAQRASRGFDQQKMNQRSHAKLRSAETGERRRTCRVPKRVFLASNKKHQSSFACLSGGVPAVTCTGIRQVQTKLRPSAQHHAHTHTQQQYLSWPGSVLPCDHDDTRLIGHVTTRITRESHPWAGEGELEQDLGSQPSLTCTTRFSCKAPPRPDPQAIALPLHTQGCCAVKCAQKRCCVLGPT